MIRSAVAVLETPSSYILQRRPDLPGRLAYPGQLQFLGGHANEGESLRDAVIRELVEETTLQVGGLISSHSIVDLWQGPYTGQDRYGKPVERTVGLFRVVIDEATADDLELKEGGELVSILKDPESIAAAQDLTPFAAKVLGQLVAGEQVWL